MTLRSRIWSPMATPILGLGWEEQAHEHLQSSGTQMGPSRYSGSPKCHCEHAEQPGTSRLATSSPPIQRSSQPGSHSNYSVTSMSLSFPNISMGHKRLSEGHEHLDPLLSLCSAPELVPKGLVTPGKWVSKHLKPTSRTREGMGCCW